eukprot:m.189252 g.189252  ORF g.189252 m.189252 type:complete len:366 (-) comp18204_c0_seq2:4795-5892(-)
MASPVLSSPDSCLSDATTALDCPDFALQYGTHCQALTLVALDERFDEIQDVLASFWQVTVPKGGWAGRVGEPAFVAFVRRKDEAMYEYILSSLIPDVFRNLSPTYIKQMRMFAKHLESWLTAATLGLDAALVDAIVTVGVAFAQKLRRHTGLNHLAQAARGVLTNPVHVSQMLSDYGRVDFGSILEQTQAVCEGCDAALVTRLESRFRKFHSENNTLEEWANWLQEVVRESLQRFEQGEHFVANAREFLLRWSFLSSLVIRDLTLRSATSFGMFHLMRLLCDEYVFFLIERAIQSKVCPSVTHVANGGTEQKAKSELYGDDLGGNPEQAADMAAGDKRGGEVLEQQETETEPSGNFKRARTDGQS